MSVGVPQHGISSLDTLLSWDSWVWDISKIVVVVVVLLIFVLGLLLLHHLLLLPASTDTATAATTRLTMIFPSGTTSSHITHKDEISGWGHTPH